MRRKTKQFAYKGDDEPIQDPKENFKVNFNFAILDSDIQSIEKRFTLIQKMSQVFGFFYTVCRIKLLRELWKFVWILKKLLKHEDSNDIDTVVLNFELQAFAIDTIFKVSVTTGCTQFYIQKQYNELYYCSENSKLNLIKTLLQKSMP